MVDTLVQDLEEVVGAQGFDVGLKKLQKSKNCKKNCRSMRLSVKNKRRVTRFCHLGEFLTFGILFKKVHV
jgi:hypothetical protein